jgi:hypothetical protein
MAQHDYDITNQTFPSFRSDLNSVLEAINTSNSGTSRPSSAVAGTIWLDTTSASTPTLKFYDGADDISLATLDYSANTVNWIDSTVVIDIVNDTTPQLGGNLDVNGNSLVSTANGNITFTPDGTGKVVISGLSYPTSDGTSGQAIVTDGSGNLSFADAGRLGTVDWNTTAITADPANAVSGTGYFANTTSSAFTITLPTSPSAGDIVAIRDYAQTFATNNLTIGRNGQPIDGQTFDLILSTNGIALTLVYVDGTQGWKSVNSNEIVNGPRFITATGGTVTCCGDYKIHTFTSPGTFTVCSVGNPAGSDTVDYLVVAGGGSGGGRNGGSGAGGSGGLREGYNPGSYTASPLATTALPITAQGYPITVGAGGAGKPSATGGKGNTGSNSIFSSITSSGGGGGGALSSSGPTTIGAAGGSGGGAGIETDNLPLSYAGAGNTPPVSPPQGNNGGNNFATSFPSSTVAGGGGGGAGATGGNASCSTGGTRGCGVDTSISGSTVNYAQGGSAVNFGSPVGGLGGNNPTPATTVNGVDGGTNKGGGGGGAGSDNNTGDSGAGGSGIVIIRYKYQ